MNRDTPQLMASGCRWLVTSCRPMVLPDMVPVMAQSSVPARICGSNSAKGTKTAVAPSASTRSACVTDDTRTRRLARSASDAKARLQNTTCAG